MVRTFVWAIVVFFVLVANGLTDVPEETPFIALYINDHDPFQNPNPRSSVRSSSITHRHPRSLGMKLLFVNMVFRERSPSSDDRDCGFSSLLRRGFFRVILRCRLAVNPVPAFLNAFGDFKKLLSSSSLSDKTFPLVFSTRHYIIDLLRHLSRLSLSLPKAPVHCIYEAVVSPREERFWVSNLVQVITLANHGGSNAYRSIQAQEAKIVNGGIWV
ncbi:hypothetical protein C8R42DRAFT_719712 [Lentinula raphanica]|nr:hypothetical protein C8R42DRAFT_719712 [Lentinula raphanica]